MVKINEFHDMDIPDEILPKPDWNVGEDLLVFMRNDPMFYRKTLFPAVEDYKANNDKKIIIRVVKKGLNNYCNKFNIQNPVEELMNDRDILEVVKNIIMQDVKGKED
jgi:hypothetical protein